MNQGGEMAHAGNQRLRDAAALAFVLAISAVLLTVEYRVVFLFARFLVNEYSAHFGNSHF